MRLGQSVVKGSRIEREAMVRVDTPDECPHAPAIVTAMGFALPVR